MEIKLWVVGFITGFLCCLFLIEINDIVDLINKAAVFGLIRFLDPEKVLILVRVEFKVINSPFLVKRSNFLKLTSVGAFYLLECCIFSEDVYFNRLTWRAIRSPFEYFLTVIILSN